MNIEMIRILICPRSEPQMFIFSINVCLTGIALAKLLPSVCVCVRAMEVCIFSYFQSYLFDIFSRASGSAVCSRQHVVRSIRHAGPG